MHYVKNHLIPNAERISLVSLTNIYIVCYPREREMTTAREWKRENDIQRETTNEPIFIFKFDPSDYYFRYRSGRSGHLSSLSIETFINILRKSLISHRILVFIISIINQHIISMNWTCSNDQVVMKMCNLNFDIQYWLTNSWKVKKRNIFHNNNERERGKKKL